VKKIDVHIHQRPDDPDMDNYLDCMDRHDVEFALIHAVRSEGKANTDVLRAVKAHPDRFFGSVHVDLRYPVEECVTIVRHYAEHGFRCVKLFPNLGFDPNDEHLEPFWREVESLGLMCLSHCGWLALNKENQRERRQSLTATPFHCEVPARRHPGINFIMAHFGGGATYLETIVLTSRLDNFYADTCPGWGKWVFENNMPGLQSLDFGHVLYGTDNAGNGYSDQEKWWTDTLSSMGRTEKDIYDYFYGNAAGLLGIE